MRNTVCRQARLYALKIKLSLVGALTRSRIQMVQGICFFKCARCPRCGCLSDTLPWGNKAGENQSWLTVPFLDVSIQNEAFRAISDGMKCFRFVIVEKVCVGKISTRKMFDIFICVNF